MRSAEGDAQHDVIYCDYCAVFTDWDFQIAINDPASKLPGPAYEAIQKRLAPDVKEALENNDRDRYHALQREIFTAYLEACPAACSPRCGDPAYREAWIEYSAKGATIGAFDPTTKERGDELRASVNALEWERINGNPKVVASTFWRMYEAVAISMSGPIPDTEAGRAVANLKHPDGAPLELLRKMSISTFVQAWIPYLTESDSHELLARTKLATEYVQPPRVSSSNAPCGHCGKAMTIVEGAQKTLCEACGYVTKQSITCHHCGTAVPTPEDGTAFACPSCRAELRVMRW